jgi:hypothetical protein
MQSRQLPLPTLAAILLQRLCRSTTTNMSYPSSKGREVIQIGCNKVSPWWPAGCNSFWHSFTNLASDGQDGNHAWLCLSKGNINAKNTEAEI